MNTLGRGSIGRLTFHKNYVLKIAPKWEPSFMRRFPDVFVPVVSEREFTDEMSEFQMPLWDEPFIPDDTHEALTTGARLLTEKLWPMTDLFPQPEWRTDLWPHLIRAAWHNDPKLRAKSHVVGAIVAKLPDVERGCEIHGDPTLANMLCNPKTNEWRWCDPLDRKFIPRTPAVDVGKMFQSCWGYEMVITGLSKKLRFAEKTARDIIKITGVSHDHAMLWCYVHMIRLLPYQQLEHRKVFVEFLNDLRV